MCTSVRGGEKTSFLKKGLGWPPDPKIIFSVGSVVIGLKYYEKKNLERTLTSKHSLLNVPLQISTSHWKYVLLVFAILQIKFRVKDSAADN